MTAREVLDGIKAQLAAITPPPYVLSRFDHGGGRMYTEDGARRKLVADTFKEGDREFHYTAPSTVARLTAAVESVLAQADAAEEMANGYVVGEDVIAALNMCARGIRAAIENALTKESQ